MDCCRELAAAGAFVALQDLGAAGLTSAASEMAAKGRVGLDIDLDLVPLREALAPAEILVLGEPGADARRGLARAAGRGGGRVPALGPRRHGHRAGDRGREPGGALGRRGRGGPARPPARGRGAGLRGAAHARRARPTPLDLASLAEPDDAAAAWRGAARPAEHRLASAGSTSATTTSWAPTRSAAPAGDAAVVRLPGSDRAIALTTDCAERLTEVDPRQGGRASVLEAARNLACVGAPPDRGDRLPQLPQPREGLDRLAAGRGDRRDVRRAVGASACRSSPGTCRSTMSRRHGRSCPPRWSG